MNQPNNNGLKEQNSERTSSISKFYRNPDTGNSYFFKVATDCQSDLEDISFNNAGHDAKSLVTNQVILSDDNLEKEDVDVGDNRKKHNSTVGRAAVSTESANHKSSLSTNCCENNT